MTGYANAYEMRMPAHYVDMNKEEMEYDGRGFWGGVWDCICGLGGMVVGTCMVLTGAGAGAGVMAIAGGAGTFLGGCIALGESDSEDDW